MPGSRPKKHDEISEIDRRTERPGGGGRRGDRSPRRGGGQHTEEYINYISLSLSLSLLLVVVVVQQLLLLLLIIVIIVLLCYEGTPRREQRGQGTEAAPSGTNPAGGHIDARRGRGTGAVAEAVPGTQTNELAKDEAVPRETPL